MSTPQCTIAVIGKVHENHLVSGDGPNGTFRFNKLTLLTDNGMHFEYAVARKGAKDATLAVFAAIKPGQLVRLSNCFLSAFTSSNGNAHVQILAGKAEIVK